MKTIAEMRATALGATQGEWRVEYDNVSTADGLVAYHKEFNCDVMMGEADAEHIATFSPTQTLALLDKIEKYEKALRGWNSWAEMMVDEGMLDSGLVAEYHVAAEALKEGSDETE